MGTGTKTGLIAALVAVDLTCLSAADFHTVDLGRSFDCDGISFAGNLDDGDFNFQCSYPAEEMPEPGPQTFGGIPFDFPAYHDGTANCVKLCNRSIALPDVPAAAIYILGSAVYSRHPTAPATLYYADGAPERHLVMLGGPAHGNVEGLRTTVMHVQNRIGDHGGWPLYLAAIYPRREAPLKAIVFDSAFSGARAFAMTLASTAPPGLTADTLPRFGLASVTWGDGRRGTNRAEAVVAVAREAAPELQVDWTFGSTRKTETLRTGTDCTGIARFDYEPDRDRETISLTVTDRQGRRITLSEAVTVVPRLEVRTENPVVLGDTAPLETEVLVNPSAAVRRGELTVEVDVVRQGEQGEEQVTDTRRIAPIDPPCRVVRFPADTTPVGDYVIRARLRRGEETVAQAESGLIVRRAQPPDGSREVRFDTDGTMLVDGKRTFPIGMLANFSAADVSELAATGANCVMIGGPTMGQQAGLWDLFDAVHAAGMFVIGSVHPDEDLYHVRRMTHIQREHPALIGYHFLEEPGAHFSDRPNGVETIHRSYVEIRRLDPDHFVDLIDWPASSYARYGVFADVITPDRYTRGPKPRPNIVKETIRQIRDAREATGGRKPVWIMPQMFSFLVESRHGLTKDPSIPEGPTPEQVRLSAYASIVGGAKGILFFEYGYARSTTNGMGGVSWEGPDNLWSAGKHVLTEIAALRPVLEAVGEPREIKATEGIGTWAKRHAGDWYLIAVNGAERPVDATIDLGGLDIGGEAAVLFENGRTCRFEARRISDRFGPDGAHVYRIAAAR